MRSLGHGQIWWAELDKIRPVVILTRTDVASRMHRVMVAPVTTKVRAMDSEVLLGEEEGVEDGSVASLDNVESLHINQLVYPAGSVHPLRWDEFCRAMRYAMGCLNL